jgi:hypothetical protein
MGATGGFLGALVVTTTTSSQEAPAPGLLETLIRWGEALSGRLAALIALGAAVLYLALINRYSGAYDEGVYWQSLRAMAQGHALFTLVFSSQPPYFLLSVYPFYLLFGQTIAAARVGIAIFALIGVISMYWLAAQRGGRWAGLIAAALLATQPSYLQQARSLQSDGPAVAISVLAVALTVAATQREARARRWLLALGGAALVYALLIKLFAIAALVPMILLVLTPLFTQFDAGDGRLKRADGGELRSAARATLPDVGWLAAGAVGALVILLAPFVGALGALWAQVVSFHLVAQQGLPSNLTDNLGAVVQDFIPLGALALVTVGAAVWRRAWRVAIPLLWLLASLAIILRLNPFFSHYVALVTPAFALLIALAPGLLAPLLRRPVANGAPLLTVVAIVALLVAASASDLKSTTDGLRQTPGANALSQFAAINTFTTPGEEIVTDDPYLAAEAGHSVPPELVDTSYVRVSTGDLTLAQVERAIERDHIRVVMLATNRLASLPGFMPWLRARFKLAAQAGQGGAGGDGYQVYIRIPSGSPVA